MTCVALGNMRHPVLRLAAASRWKSFWRSGCGYATIQSCADGGRNNLSVPAPCTALHHHFSVTIPAGAVAA